MAATIETPEDRLAFAACIAHVLGDLGTPPPRPETADPLPIWRSWLAGRGFALVDVVDPARFQMPGYWIAVLRPDGGVPRPVVMFGSPSGAVFDPRGVELPTGEVLHGWVLAPLDLRTGTWGAGQPRTHAATTEARLEAILVAESREGPMHEVETAVVREAGIEGDRYARGDGTFTNPNSNGHAVTLIAAEALEATQLPDGTPSTPLEMRRNLVTRGVELNDLVGRRFRVGEVELIGRRPCEPCSHLQKITRQGILRAFIHRGGLRADVLATGRIAIGDVVTPAEPSS